MRFKFNSGLLVIVLLVAASPVVSQVVPAAYQGNLGLVVGGGASGFEVDWGNGRMYGGTLWADYYPGIGPSFLRSLGIELEVRDISLGRGKYHPNNMRQDTATLGGIYTLNRYQNFKPYAKFTAGLGSMDFHTAIPTYNHDTRTVKAPGVGLQYRVYRNFWFRAEYEYQFWGAIAGGISDPQGYTVGVVYDFRHRHIF